MKNNEGVPSASNRLFAFVARKPATRACNQCHVFAELNDDQPARAIVNFVNKLMLSENSTSTGRQPTWCGSAQAVVLHKAFVNEE